MNIQTETISYIRVILLIPKLLLFFLIFVGYQRMFTNVGSIIIWSYSWDGLFQVNFDLLGWVRDINSSWYWVGVGEIAEMAQTGFPKGRIRSSSPSYHFEVFILGV